MKNTPSQIDRRSFLVSGATALGGLIVAFHVPSGLNKVFAASPEAQKLLYPPNAFIRIAPDNTITVVINRLEMGQGPHTALAQLLGDELEVDWSLIRSESSNSDVVYNDPKMHMIMTGGSTSVANSWEQYRKIGAGMREMLIEAAAQKWKVPKAELKAEKGYVVHSKHGKLSYGELATAAGQLKLPENSTLKPKKDFKLIGKSMKRVDATAKSDGSAIFGMDVRLPGMVYAAIARPHILNAKLISFDEAAAKKIPGVTHVFKFGNRVAVVGRNTHIVRTAKEALNAKWDAGAAKNLTQDTVMDNFKKLAEKEGPIAKSVGDAEKEMGNTQSHIEAVFEFPYLAHAAMEPLNCTIDFDGKKADLYAGFQFPQNDHSFAQKILGIPKENIQIHVTYAGGSFGRRATPTSDWVADSCEVAKVLKKPVKIVWSREDDMTANYYRPIVLHKVKLGFNKANALHAWKHTIVGQSFMKGTFMEAFMIKDGVDATLVEGVNDTLYDIPNFKVDQTLTDGPLTTLWWRSVGHTHTAYVMETMIDEVATTMKKDPLELRLEMLKKSPRHVAVLNLLKKKTNWGKAKIPKGRAWGLALHESFGSVVGHVAEVSLVDGMPKVHKVWSAAYCGQVVNPIGAATQIEGGIVFGLSAALRGEIRFKDGQIEQTNYDSYEVVRMGDMPVVDVSFVETDEAPTGLGEPGVPAIAPAVANAVFKLNGKRLRRLPFSKELQS